MDGKKRNFYVKLLITLLIILATSFNLGGCMSDSEADETFTGCYTADTEIDENARPVASGSLTYENFGGYYPGGCGASESCIKDNVQYDGDETKGACSCIITPDWDDELKCCGDDEEDCMAISSGHICWQAIQYPSPGEWSWLETSKFTGTIIDSGCDEQTAVSDGSSWIFCTQDSAFSTGNNPLTIESVYLCKSGSISECCGESTNNCNSLVGSYAYGGQRAIMGDEPTELDNKAYYCTSDNDWSTDLDTKTEEDCEIYGFDWTGTKCCSEEDDPEEYYNDEDHGCWDEELVMSGTYPREDYKDVVNYKGQFYGCKIDANNKIPDNNDLLSIKDHHTGEQLIENLDYCETVADGFFYCSYDEEFKEYAEEGIHKSTVPWSNESKGKCCPEDTCFDGSSCIANQAGNPTSPAYEGFRCIDGMWVGADMVYTPETMTGVSTSGYCPNTGQCLVSAQGKLEDNDDPDGNPQCISSGQFIGDNFCENGVWSSRTKFLATQMTSLASVDYTLYCSNYLNALNYFNYHIGQDIASNYIVDNSNNYCILESGGKVIIGTTLNGDINDMTPKYMNLLGGSSCQGGTDNYASCSSGNTVWYNSGFRSIIYSRSSFSVNSMGSDISAMNSQYNSLIGAKISDLFSKIQTRFPSIYDTSFYDSGVNMARNLYISKKGSKTVIGVMEGMQYNTILFEYLGFTTEICEIINTYNEYHGAADSGIECHSDGTNHYAIAQGSIFSNSDPTNIWPDLGANLRIN